MYGPQVQLNGCTFHAYLLLLFQVPCNDRLDINVLCMAFLAALNKIPQLQVKPHVQ